MAETRAAIDELFRLYDIRVVGREQLGGHPVIAVRLDPKPNYRPRTKEGEWMKHMRLRAWIHETDYEVVRAEADVLEDMTVGWGAGGPHPQGRYRTLRSHEGQRRGVAPQTRVVNATGRSLVFRTFTIDAVTEWWDFKNGSAVETREQIGRSDQR